MSARPERDTQLERSKRLTAIVCGGVFLSMVGMAYAAVPLYALFCQVTGYGGTTQRVDQYSDKILDRKITVRFDANTAGVPWDFQPVQRSVTINIGETVQADYRARAGGSENSSGKATFNVTPEMAGAYFNKVECFCFTDTTLKPGEEIDMPVVFYVDPAIVDVPELKNIQTITLSYTFFSIDTKPLESAGAKVEKQNNKLGG